MMRAEPTTVAAYSGLVDDLWAFVLATKAELLLFCAAVIVYLLLFGNVAPKTKRQRASKAARTLTSEADDPLDGPEPAQRANLTAAEQRQLERDFGVAFQAGDHRQVLRCWAALKGAERLPAVSLAHAVESMQRFKKDSAFVLREIRAYFKRYSTDVDTPIVNGLLESLAKRLDSFLVEKVLEVMSSMAMKPDQRTHEVLLSMHFSTRNFSQVCTLLEEMSSNGMQLTTRARIVAVKTALKMGNAEAAKQHFRELKHLWEGSGETATVSAAPRHIVSQFIDLACKDRQLPEFLPLLDGVPLSEDATNAMLSECIRNKDPVLTKRVEQLVRGQGQQLSDATYALLTKAFAGDFARVQELLDEVTSTGGPLSSELALAFLASCVQARCVELADKVLANSQPGQMPVLSGFIRFYCDCEQYEKACDLYEAHMERQRSSEAPKQPTVLDSRIERMLMAAALRCGRRDLAKDFLDASPADVPKHIAMIRNCAASGDLRGAVEVFEALVRSGAEANSVVYNTVLDACVECRDLGAAERWMSRTKSAGLADVVSYNTLIKAHLQNGNFTKARMLMDLMREEGLQPNRVTFNELVNGLTAHGSGAQRGEIWSIVREMKAAGVKPNQVTCSILLKGLGPNSREQDIYETMDLISDMDEPMDEVLLSSMVEACVRIGKPDLLAEKLKQLQGAEGLAVNGSHTFGSLIKAYGHARDINGVWRCWKEMRSRHVRPTSITLGCMVEAVVCNGDTEGAFELIHQMREDEQCRDALNAVIYCSVLKGFTREKKMQRVWAVYEEMIHYKVDLSVVTYNTLLDACARCSRMDRVPTIIEDMQRHSVEPNLITYSTMVKGHCQCGEIDRAFTILEAMKGEGKFKPDEIMYNSLLDGCAQNNLADKGLALLERMQREGVAPSNFTLSLLVKLMNRCRKLDSAFALVKELSAKYRFRPNVHVYTNLIQACVANRSLPRAMTTFAEMLAEHVRPENRTYAILARASLAQSQSEQAAGLLRAALGLPLGPKPQVAESQASLATASLDPVLVGEVLLGLTEKGRVHDLAVPLLSDIKQLRPQIRVDAAVQRKVMAAGMAQDLDGGAREWSSGNGGSSPGNPRQNRGGRSGGGGGYGNGSGSGSGRRWS